jgi:hypothetical protein
MCNIFASILLFNIRGKYGDVLRQRKIHFEILTDFHILNPRITRKAFFEMPYICMNEFYLHRVDVSSAAEVSEPHVASAVRTMNMEVIRTVQPRYTTHVHKVQ